MPIAKRKVDRVRQVARWLDEKFPLPWPRRLEIHKNMKPDPGEPKSTILYGDCDVFPGPLIRIRVNARRARHEMVETLLHEWAHARTIKPPKLERQRLEDGKSHDDEYWLEYGRIYRLFHDFDGAAESGRY